MFQATNQCFMVHIYSWTGVYTTNLSLQREYIVENLCLAIKSYNVLELQPAL